MSFKEIGKLMKKKPKIDRPDAPTENQWLENFTIWLEESYDGIVHSPRLPGLHASSLYDTCPRKEGLMLLYPPGPDKKVAGQVATFEMGQMMHWWWQHRYLGPKQELYGNWFCSGCRLTTTGFMPLNCACGSDWRTTISYKEMGIEDKELGFTGHADGILVDRVSDTKRVFEFKSISPSEYKDLKKPKHAHVIQSNAYMRGLKLKEALIVYQNKGSQCEWKFMENGDVIPGPINVKVFLVRFDDKLWKNVEDIIRARNTALAEFQALLSEGKLTKEVVCASKRICETKGDEAAKYCPMRTKCFELSAPGEKPKNDDPFAEYRIPI